MIGKKIMLMMSLIENQKKLVNSTVIKFFFEFMNFFVYALLIL